MHAFSPWPIEEVLYRPLATWLFAFLVPIATARLLALIWSPRGHDRFTVSSLFASAPVRRASWLVTAIQGVLAFALGLDALGPALVDHPRSAASLAFASASLGLALFGGAVGWRARRGEPASSAVTEGQGAPSHLAASSAALLVGVVLIATAFLGRELTRVSVDEIASVDATQTWRALRVEPWDANATLALAWQARRRGDLERAEAYASEARRAGAPLPELHELRAELLAARGDCEGARAAFDAALTARIVDPLVHTLELGTFHLPPTFISACPSSEATEDAQPRREAQSPLEP